MNPKSTAQHGFQLISPEPHASEASHTKEVLQEVFELLEEFGPAWYTEELHKRAAAALKCN
jgi:hypothetical protein